MCARTHKGIFLRVYEEVKKIPKGSAASYGEIAKRAKTSPRVVGFALHCNPDSENIPCHRVVFKNGEASSGYVFGGKKAQEKKLYKEKRETTTY